MYYKVNFSIDFLIIYNHNLIPGAKLCLIIKKVIRTVKR